MRRGDNGKTVQHNAANRARRRSVVSGASPKRCHSTESTSITSRASSRHASGTRPAARVRQRAVPAGGRENATGRHEFAQLALGCRPASCHDVLERCRQPSLHDLAHQCSHRSQDELITARVDGRPFRRCAREGSDLACCRHDPRPPDSRDRSPRALRPLRDQEVRAAVRRHIPQAICPACRRAGDHRAGSGVEQTRTDQVPLLERAGEGRVQARHHALPPAATVQQVTQGCDRKTVVERLPASDDPVLASREAYQTRRQAHGRSLAVRRPAAERTRIRCGW
jgi:hypothetical protein